MPASFFAFKLKVTAMNLNCCENLFNEPMLSRELDQFVAEKLLGWKITDVGSDVSGKNSCQILTETGILPHEIQLPGKGIVPKMYLVPEYSRSMPLAISLASKFGFKTITFGVHFIPYEIPESIVRAVIAHWQSSWKQLIQQAEENNLAHRLSDAFN